MTKHRSKYMLFACCAIAFLTLAASTSAAMAEKWTLRQLPPAYFGSHPTSQGLEAISCPIDSLCVAVGLNNTLAFSQAPTGDVAKWHVVHPPYPCIGGAPACPKFVRGGLRAISCASQDFCVAVSYDGFVYVSTEPTGGADAWLPTVINEGESVTRLKGVSCPSPSFCVAVSRQAFTNSTSRILTSTNPTSGSWQITQLSSSLDFQGVSCGSPSLCVAVARDGRLVVSTEPTGGASAWREVGSPGGSGELEGVDCISTLLCAAGNAGGNILTSTNPADLASWNEANAGRSVLITDVSCPTAQHCLAVDNNGDVLTSTNPTAGPGFWESENLIPFPDPEIGKAPRNALFGASCSSASFCALVGSDGHIFTSTDPFSAADKPRTRRKAVPRPRTTLIFTDDFGAYTPTRRHRVHASFRFYSRSPISGFECKRGRTRYRRCRSPLRYWVPRGRHVLRVRAIGPTGLRGPAAIKRFRVTKPVRFSR